MELLENNIDRQKDGIRIINREEKINFTKNQKNGSIILKKKMKKEYHAQKRQKHNCIQNKKMFNSSKYYIYNIIYNKIFMILNFFMIFFFISSSKQNTDPSLLLSMQKIVITISGPEAVTIFGNDFRYQPSALFINETEIDLSQKSFYNTFDLKGEEKYNQNILFNYTR